MAASTTNSGIMANMVSGLGGVKREDSGKQEQMLDILLSTVTNHDGIIEESLSMTILMMKFLTVGNL